MENYQFRNTSATYLAQLMPYRALSDFCASLPAPVNLATVDSFSTCVADPTGAIVGNETRA
jgi:hypothetical protein